MSKTPYWWNSKLHASMMILSGIWLTAEVLNFLGEWSYMAPFRAIWAVVMIYLLIGMLIDSQKLIERYSS